MKTLFQMGFDQGLFGSRATNPTLGRAWTPAPASRKMGQTTLNGDELLKQLTVAERQVSAANQFAADQPNLKQALGNDYATFQNYMSIVTDGGVAATEANVMSQLEGSAPGVQIDITSGDYAAVQNYIQAAEILGQLVKRQQPKKVLLTPGATSAGVLATRNDLVAPLLVGGGVLAIGLIALLARA